MAPLVNDCSYGTEKTNLIFSVYKWILVYIRKLSIHIFMRNLWKYYFCSKIYLHLSESEILNLLYAGSLSSVSFQHFFVLTCTMNYMFQEIISKNIQTKNWLTINFYQMIYIYVLILYTILKDRFLIQKVPFPIFQIITINILQHDKYISIKCKDTEITLVNRQGIFIIFHKMHIWKFGLWYTIP